MCLRGADWNDGLFKFPDIDLLEQFLAVYPDKMQEVFLA